MYLKSLFYLITICILSACQNNIHSDYHEFSDQKWAADKPISFEYNPQDISLTYHILLTMRYNVAIADELFQFQVKITSPSGKVEEKAVSIPRTDGTGKLRSEELGDLGDIEDIFLKNYQFKESGTYKFEIAHKMLMEEWGGILGLGIKIQKAK